ESWKNTGVIYVQNSRTKQMLPHNFQFYTDFKHNENRFSIKRAVQNLNIPQLIVHGSDDSTVLVKEARAINSWNAKSELFIVEDADHVFGAKHPWEKKRMPNDLKSVVNRTMDFLE
ncbi:MAG TPA: alpha/beta hydrolase, partial [Aequorivita sp.]|nr:alpha/beta hydrolase [Aequorivita sp.]